MDDVIIPPPPRVPTRLRPVPPPPPSPKPQPDQYAVADAVADLGRRVGALEKRMGVLFKRSVITVVLADVLLGALKLAAELLTK